MPQHTIDNRTAPLLYSGSVSSPSTEKIFPAVELARSGLTPDRFITPDALENAFRVVCAVGGSTNAVIHLEAIAGRLGHRLGFDAMTRWSRTTPVLADVRPSGPYLLEDLQEQIITNVLQQHLHDGSVVMNMTSSLSSLTYSKSKTLYKRDCIFDLEGWSEYAGGSSGD